MWEDRQGRASLCVQQQPVVVMHSKGPKGVPKPCAAQHPRQPLGQSIHKRVPEREKGRGPAADTQQQQVSRLSEHTHSLSAV